MRVEVDVAHAEMLGERSKAALYEIVREAFDEAIRRGPPTLFSVHVAPVEGSTLELTIHDNAPSERRRRSIEVLEERARTLGATLSVDHGDDGTTMRIQLAHLRGLRVAPASGLREIRAEPAVAGERRRGDLRHPERLAVLLQLRADGGRVAFALAELVAASSSRRTRDAPRCIGPPLRDRLVVDVVVVGVLLRQRVDDGHALGKA